MKRILDALAICICLLGISYLYEYKQTLSNPLEQSIGSFEQDVEAKTILKDEYSKKRPILLNNEENKAGRLGKDISSGLESVTNVVVDVVGELVNLLLK